MAAAQHEVSRRSLLGAALALPVLPRHPGLGSHQSTTLMGSLDPGSTFIALAPEGRWIPGQARNDGAGESRTVTNWDRALARYARADAAVEAVKGRGDDRLYDRLLGRHNKALARLLRTPAPHLAALAAKLDLLVAHQVWELNFAEPSLAALQRDAKRLASARRSS